MTKHDDDWDDMDASQDALTRIFREMNYDYNVNYRTLIRLLTRYIDDLPPSVTREQRANRRTNMIKALTKDTMTMDMFCKALRVLQHHHIDIIVIAHRSDGKTIHRVGMSLGDPIDKSMLLVSKSNRVVDPNIDPIRDLILPDTPDAVVFDGGEEVTFSLNTETIRPRKPRKPRKVAPLETDSEFPDASSNESNPF